jgi:hypothetical protein
MRIIDAKTQQIQMPFWGLFYSTASCCSALVSGRNCAHAKNQTASASLANLYSHTFHLAVKDETRGLMASG